MIRTDGSNPDDEAFGSVYDHRVIRRMLPYVARQKHLAALAVAPCWSTRRRSPPSPGSSRSPSTTTSASATSPD